MLIEMLKGAGGGEWFRGIFRDIISFVSLLYFILYFIWVGLIRGFLGEFEECLSGLGFFIESWEMGVFFCWLDLDDCWEFNVDGFFFILVFWFCVNCVSRFFVIEVVRSCLDEFNNVDKFVSFKWLVINFWRFLGRLVFEEFSDGIEEVRGVFVFFWDWVVLFGMLVWGKSFDDVMGVGRGMLLSMFVDFWFCFAVRCWWIFIWYCWYFIIWWCRFCSCCFWVGFRLVWVK